MAIFILNRQDAVSGRTYSSETVAGLWDTFALFNRVHPDVMTDWRGQLSSSKIPQRGTAGERNRTWREGV